MKSLFRFCMDNNAVMFTDIVKDTGDIKVQIRIPHRQLAIMEIIPLRDRVSMPNKFIEERLVEKFKHLLEHSHYHQLPKEV